MTPDILPRYYQPDIGISGRTGRKADPMTSVEKPIAMKMRMVTRPPTKTKHYRRKRITTATPDDRKRTFY